MATKKVGRPKIKYKKVFIGVYVHPLLVDTKEKAEDMRGKFTRVANNQAVKAGIKIN